MAFHTDRVRYQTCLGNDRTPPLLPIIAVLDPDLSNIFTTQKKKVYDWPGSHHPWQLGVCLALPIGPAFRAWVITPVTTSAIAGGGGQTANPNPWTVLMFEAEKWWEQKSKNFSTVGRPTQADDLASLGGAGAFCELRSVSGIVSWCEE